jgi:hypothetical protein
LTNFQDNGLNWRVWEGLSQIQGKGNHPFMKILKDKHGKDFSKAIAGTNIISFAMWNFVYFRYL